MMPPEPILYAGGATLRYGNVTINLIPGAGITFHVVPWPPQPDENGNPPTHLEYQVDA